MTFYQILLPHARPYFPWAHFLPLPSLGIKLFLLLYVMILVVCRVTGPPGATMFLKGLLGVEEIKASGESRGSWNSLPDPLALYHLPIRESKGRLFSFV
jgi:hypothetical protein